MRTRRHARACVEGLEPRQLLSVTIFTGKWTGTYQLDAQSTADSTDPHYTGTGTLVVDLSNGVGTVTFSGLSGANVVRSEGSTTETLTATVVSASGTAVIADPGTGVTGTLAASGQLDDDLVTQMVNAPPIHTHNTSPDPLAFPFTGTFSNGVITGNFESSVYQSGHFTLTGGQVMSGGGGGTTGGNTGGTGGTSKPTKTLAQNVYKKAVALAEGTPELDYGGTTAKEKAAILLQKHEGSVLFVYPDRHGNPTVGVGFNLNLALNPDAKQTIDNLFGAGTYDKMMASYQRTMDAWKAEHHDGLDGFEYGTAAWKKFFKEHGGTTDKSLNMASGSDGDILTNVLTKPDPVTGDVGTSAKLLENVLPGYISNARSLVGASVWDNDLDEKEQAALIDIVYNRGYTNTKNEFGDLLTALQNGDDIAAAVALMDAKLSTGKSKGKVWAQLDPTRAIDDFRYLVSGDESKLK